MPPTPPDAFTGWSKSSHSGSNQDCVEVGRAPGEIGVRDSKASGQGPVLAFGCAEWAVFLERIKRDARSLR